MNYNNEHIKVAILLLVMLATLMVGMTGMATASNTQQPAGSGTVSDPYQITNVEELQWINNDLDGVYKLQNNIDASGTEAWNDGKGFKPIGNSTNEFTGIIDGRNYRVSDLYINRESSNVALVGVSQFNIKDIGISNAYIVGKDSVGALVAYNDGGNISNSFSTGYVDGKKRVGGLVGLHSGNSIINNSYSHSNVNGNDTVGGLVGYTFNSNVSNSFSTGNVNGNDTVGGLVGTNNGGTIANSYWDTESTGQSSSAGGTGLTTSEMTGDATNNVVGFDYLNTWQIVQSSDSDATSDGYPILQSVDREAQLLSQDVTEPAPSNYDLTIQTEDSSGNAINTTYTIFDAGSSTQIVSGAYLGSDGTVTQSLESGNYEVSIAISDPTYEPQSTNTFTLDSTESKTLSTSQSTYDLTVETEDDDASAADTDYKIVDPSGSQVASGNTGADGLATHSLTYHDYDVTVASSDVRYAEDTQAVTLDSTQTQFFTLSDETYDLTINTVDSDGNAIDTTYSVLDDTGTEVVSGQTGSDGSVVEPLEYGDYDVRTSATDTEYDQRSRSVTLDSATTESFNPSLSSYNITIGASDQFEGIETDYEVLDSGDNVVASGTTYPNGAVTETLPAGDYTVKYANGDTEVYSESESVILDSDENINPTLDRIELTVKVDSAAIFEGVETTFDANVSNRPDTDYKYDWYVNNESVATGSDDTVNYTFNDSGEFQVRVETTIDGNEYVATRPIPEGAWTDEEIKDGAIIFEELHSTDKVLFGEIQVKTVDKNGAVVATHIVNANLRENLTGDQIGEDRIRVSKKGEVTTWQVIATHDAYIRAEHPDYENQFQEVGFETLAANSLYSTSIAFDDTDKNGTVDKPRSFGYDLIQDATIIDGNGDSGDEGFLGGGGTPGSGSGGNAVGVLLLSVLAAAVLIMVGGLSLLSLIPGITGGEGLFGGEDRIPNPFRWFRRDD